MDTRTLSAYDRDAADFAKEWHSQPHATDLYALLRAHFHPAGLTADVGCGSGLHAAWFAANGYPVVGIDASRGLLTEAQHRYPGLRFEFGELPLLTGVADNTFDNVFCKTVIMHLEREIIAPSVRRMLAMLKPGGILYLSWRLTDGTSDERDKHGRLYSAFDASLVNKSLAGTTIVLDEDAVSSSSHKPIRQIVARKR